MNFSIIVNNTGSFPNRPIEELGLPTWRKTMATNLVRTSQRTTPHCSEFFAWFLSHYAEPTCSKLQT